MAWDIKGSLTTKKDIRAGANIQVGNSGLIKLSDGDSSNFINLKAPSSVTSDVTLTFPATVGSANQVLTTDGSSGILSWTTPSATPAGSGTELQFKNGSAFGAVTNSAVSSSSLAIGTTTTTGAQLTVLSSGASLPALKLQAAATTAGTVSQFGIYDQGGSLVASIKADGSFAFPFVSYDVTNRSFALTPQGAPTTRNLVAANTGLFTATNVATDFFNPSQNLIAAYNASASYGTALAIGHEDGLGGAGTSITGAKIFAAASQSSGTGSKSSVYGLEAFARVVSTGGATNLAAGIFEVKNTSTATISNLYGMRILSPSNAGTVTNCTGLDIGSFYLSGSTSKAINSQGGEVYIATGNANSKGVTIHGAASQLANLLTIEDSSSSALFTFNSSGYASGQFLNSGLALRDSDNSHKLTLTTSSNLTSDQSLTFNMNGNSSRTLTLESDAKVAGTHRVFYTQTSTIAFNAGTLGGAFETILGGSPQIPANWFTVGRTIHIKIMGELTSYSSAGTYTFRVRLGTTDVANSGAVTMVNSVSGSFIVDITMSCWSVGAGTTGIDCVGKFIFNSGTTSLGAISINNSLVGNLDSTSAYNLGVSIAYGTGNSANSWTGYTATVIGYEV